MLGRDERVVHGVRLFLGLVDDAVERSGEGELRCAGHFRQALQHLVHALPQPRQGRSYFFKEVRDEPSFLVDQRQKQVLRLHTPGGRGRGFLVGRGQGFLRLDGHFFGSYHGLAS